jgi:hypothetical protein
LSVHFSFFSFLSPPPFLQPLSLLSYHVLHIMSCGCFSFELTPQTTSYTLLGYHTNWLQDAYLHITVQIIDIHACSECILKPQCQCSICWTQYVPYPVQPMWLVNSFIQAKLCDTVSWKMWYLIDRKHLTCLSIMCAFCYRISLLCTMVLGLTTTVIRGFLLLRKVSVQDMTLTAAYIMNEVFCAVWNVEGYDSKFLQNASTCIWKYTSSHLRKLCMKL